MEFGHEKRLGLTGREFVRDIWVRCMGAERSQ
jgi:hypothetical protein